VRAAEWRRVREFSGSVTAREAPAALVVQGEAGAGKSTLWRAGVATAEAVGCRVLRSEPSAAEADLSFTALSDLLTGVLPAAAAGIPGPQREALEVALLLRPAGAEPPTARAVGMGVLAVLRFCLEAGPLLIAVDDAQWLDPASLDVLVFALRRITAGPVALLLAARADAPADPLTAGAPPPSRGWRDLLAALPEADEAPPASGSRLCPGEEQVQGGQVRQDPVLADVQVSRPPRIRRRSTGIPVVAPVGGSAVGPARLGPASADPASQQPGQPVPPPGIGVLAGRADALDRDEVLLADQRRVHRAGRDHPAVGQAPPLHLPVPQLGVGRVEQVHGRRLPVPHLQSGTARVGQDRPLCPPVPISQQPPREETGRA